MSVKPDAGPVPGILRPLRLADTALRKAEMTVLCVVLFTMIALSFAQVVLRGLQHAGLAQPVPWFEDIDRHFVLWVGMLGASMAAREGRHFGVEALPKLFSETGRRRLEGVLNLIAAGVCALLTDIMWKDIVLDEIPRSREHPLFVLEGIRIANENGVGTHGMPFLKWWLLVIIPIGLVGMTFRFFLRSLEAALLTNEQWHWLERELKPDVVAAGDPGAEPASGREGAVIESATPPSTQRLQHAEAVAAEKRLEQQLAASVPGGSPAPVPAEPQTPRKTPTGEVSIVRLADLGDVADPEHRPSAAPPPDEDESLVDSDVLRAERHPDEDSAQAPTDRQNKQPDGGDRRSPGGRS